METPPDPERAPLLARLAYLTANEDAAIRACVQHRIDGREKALHEGSAAGLRTAADLLTNAIAELVVAHSQAADPGVKAGLAHAIRRLGGTP